MIEYKSLTNELCFETKNIPQASGNITEEILVENYNSGYRYFLELKCPKGNSFISEQIKFNNNMGTVTLSNAIIENRGRVYVQLVLRDNNGFVVSKSFFSKQPIYIVEESIDAVKCLDKNQVSDCLVALFEAKNEVKSFKNEVKNSIVNKVDNDAFAKTIDVVNKNVASKVDVVDLENVKKDINSKLEKKLEVTAFNSEKAILLDNINKKANSLDVTNLVDDVNKSINTKASLETLQNVKTGLQTELGKKANALDMQTELGKKANAIDMQTELGKKANTVDLDNTKKAINTELSKKVNSTVLEQKYTTLDNKINKKAEITDVNSLKQKVNSNTTKIDTNSKNINKKVQLDLLWQGVWGGKTTITLNTQANYDYLIFDGRTATGESLISIMAKTIPSIDDGQIQYCGTVALGESYPPGLVGISIQRTNNTFKILNFGFFWGGEYAFANRLNDSPNNAYFVRNVYGVKVGA